MEPPEPLRFRRFLYFRLPLTMSGSAGNGTGIEDGGARLVVGGAFPVGGFRVREAGLFLQSCPRLRAAQRCFPWNGRDKKAGRMNRTVWNQGSGVVSADIFLNPPVRRCMYISIFPMKSVIAGRKRTSR